MMVILSVIFPLILGPGNIIKLGRVEYVVLEIKNNTKT